MVFIAFPILVCAVMLFYRRPLLLLYLWPVFILITAVFVDANVEVEGFAQLPFMFLLMDVVYGFTIMHLGLYAVLQPNRFVALLRENPFLTIFFILIILYVVIYTPIHGKRALGEARKYYFMFLLPLLALISVRTSEDLRRLMLMVMLCAACVAVVALLQAATIGSLVRTQSGAQMLIIAFSMFAMLIHRIYRMVIISRRVDTALICLFAVMVLWSGQRSVWLATGMGVLLMFALYRSRSTIIAKAGVSIIGALLVLVMAVAVFPKAGEQITRGFGGILNPHADRTASWRIEAWRQQLDRVVEGRKFLFGEGLGGYFQWEFAGQDLTVAPHNAYVEMLIKLGLLGLVLYCLSAFHFFRKLLAARKRLPTSPIKAYIEIGLLNFGAAHAYLVGYGFEPIIVVFLALGVSAAKVWENAPGSSRTLPFRGGYILARPSNAPRISTTVSPQVA